MTSQFFNVTFKYEDNNLINHSRPTIRKKDLESALRVMISDNLATGDVVYEFERAFAATFDKSSSAVFVNSGTSALELILKHLNIGNGDEVIMSSFLNASPLQAVVNAGAKPVLIDITEDSYQVNMDLIIDAVNERTKAIIISHMFGNAALIDELTDIKTPVIEDASHSLGGKYREKSLGSFGDYAYFSLSATRMITSGGSGGMIVTRKKGIDAIRDIRHYDKKDNFIARFNYYPTDLQAAIGIEELNHLPRMVEVRASIASFYDSAILESKVVKPASHDSEKPSHYRYVCNLNGNMNIYEVIDMFKRHGVEVCRPVYKPLHHYLNIEKESFPNTENAFLKALSFPIYPTLQKNEAELIAKLIKQIR